MGRVGFGPGLLCPLEPKKGNATGIGVSFRYHSKRIVLETSREKFGGKNAGTLLCRNFSRTVGIHRLAHRSAGQNDGRRVMSAVYIISGIVSAGLLVYLVIALLKPEWF
jgi:K+-transporting ATPase KdpF subunit